MIDSKFSINSGRLLERLEKLASVNRLPDGSCCRLALTDADRAGRDLVVSWMREIGLEIQIDQIGNIIGISSRDGRAPIMTGSHIDTVTNGGRDDGAFGVIAGLEVAQRLKESGISLKRSLAVTAFTNEEGVRFAPDMMGSLVYAGGLALDKALSAVADDGAVLGEELTRIGYAGSMPVGEILPSAFVELHIEQGPVLHSNGGVLGAVTDLQGISWREVVFRGAPNHAGTTPMKLRRDAGYCAAKTSVFVRDLAQRMGSPQVATVGHISLAPNLISVIAGEARVLVDMRNPNNALLSSAESALDNFLHELSETEGVRIESRQLVRTEPVSFDSTILEVIDGVAQDLGYPARRMTSGAGHDAQMMARICPSAMIFVPSINGISHDPQESTDPDHLVIGANALLHTLWRLANF